MDLYYSIYIYYVYKSSTIYFVPYYMYISPQLYIVYLNIWTWFILYIYTSI